MVKKKSSNWLTWIIAVIALVALILAIVSISHTSNVTGNGIFDWLKKDRVQVKTQEKVQTQEQTGEVYRGLLGDSYLAAGKSLEDLKNYKVEYDGEGNLIYEMRMFDGKLALFLGEGYLLEDDGSGSYFVKDPNTGDVITETGCWGCGTTQCSKHTGTCNGQPCTYCAGGCSKCDMYEKSEGGNEIMDSVGGGSGIGDPNFKKVYDSQGNLAYKMKTINGALGISVGEGYHLSDRPDGSMFLEDSDGNEIMKTSCWGCAGGTCDKTDIEVNGETYTICSGTCSICSMVIFHGKEPIQ